MDWLIDEVVHWLVHEVVYKVVDEVLINRMVYEKIGKI